MDEPEYTIYSCIQDCVLKINEKISETANLLLEKPSTEGYIALIQVPSVTAVVI